MSRIPEILQGTDGIRGQVKCVVDLDGMTPLQYYLQTGFLTPAFFELYTYAFARLLIFEKSAKKGDSIVVGWDPRDFEGKFNEAACDGILKAGLNVIVAGILPTPAMPLYMLSNDSVGSVVLTASHNPADQNGIKLFHGFTGLKFLPEDDKMLTGMIKECQRQDLRSLALRGKIEDRREEVKKFFVSSCLNSENSWIKNHEFSDTLLVIDASKGAIANVAREIFSEIGCKELVYTNMEGDINAACGVADIEGKKKIRREDVFGDKALFSDYQTLITIFERADQTPSITKEELSLVALVFDGDGDRCYRLDYDPKSDGIIVSSGDLLGIHQARYIKTEGTNRYFVNTVESDLNVAITAEEMGYKAVLTGVGDKWILLKAILDNLKCQVKKGSHFAERLEALEKGDSGTALEISRLTRDTIRLKPKKMNRYAIGLEESGHCITPAVFVKGGEKFCFYGGNGIKTALNSLVAMKSLALSGTGSIGTPYSEGVKRTFYIYYVNKSLLEPTSQFKKQLTEFLTKLVEEILPVGYMSDIVEFSEESSMLYCKILKNKKLIGSIFIRNSGTEDKSALYLRGDQAISQELEKIGHTLHVYLLKNLKDKTKSIARMEKEIIQTIHSEKSLGDLESSYPEHLVNRVLKEMHLKQGLIEKNNSTWCLTRKGLSLI